MEYAEAGPVMRGDRSTEKVPLAEGVALKFFRDVLQVMLLVHAQIAESCDCLMLHMAQVVDQSNVGVLVYKGGISLGSSQPLVNHAWFHLGMTPIPAPCLGFQTAWLLVGV